MFLHVFCPQKKMNDQIVTATVQFFRAKIDSLTHCYWLLATIQAGGGGHCPLLTLPTTLAEVARFQ